VTGAACRRPARGRASRGGLLGGGTCRCPVGVAEPGQADRPRQSCPPLGWGGGLQSPAPRVWGTPAALGPRDPPQLGGAAAPGDADRGWRRGFFLLAVSPRVPDPRRHRVRVPLSHQARLEGPKQPLLEGCCRCLAGRAAAECVCRRLGGFAGRCPCTQGCLSCWEVLCLARVSRDHSAASGFAVAVLWGGGEWRGNRLCGPCGCPLASEWRRREGSSGISMLRAGLTSVGNAVASTDKR